MTKGIQIAHAAASVKVSVTCLCTYGQTTAYSHAGHIAWKGLMLQMKQFRFFKLSDSVLLSRPSLSGGLSQLESHSTTPPESEAGLASLRKWLVSLRGSLDPCTWLLVP
jgi:hypothetical protein